MASLLSYPTADTPASKDAELISAAPRKESVLVGLVGSGIQRSRSPFMHQSEASRLGIALDYRLFDVDLMPEPVPSLSEILRAAEICGFAGLNITYPFKQQILTHLDDLTTAAEAVQAVNTVVFREGKRIGHNTDVSGFEQSFEEKLADVALDDVLLIGGGGAGVAVADVLMRKGVSRLYVLDIQHEPCEALCDKLNASAIGNNSRAIPLRDVSEAPEFLDGLVNASPVGMDKHPGTPYPADRLRSGMWVADIVYFPLETELLRSASLAGCRTMNGAGMAVCQAYHAFELFTGKRPDGPSMRVSFESLGT